MGTPKAAVIDSAEFMQDEMREETGVDIKIPVDKPNSDILYIPSSADFFTNVDTMLGVAKMFHVLGANWTIPSTILEAANFGLLFNYQVMRSHTLLLNKAPGVWGAGMVARVECG